MKCSWLDVSASGMDRDELLAFVGMLDEWVSVLSERLVVYEEACKSALPHMDFSREMTAKLQAAINGEKNL